MKTISSFSKVRSLVLLIFSIALIIIIHEFGHFLSAQFFGIQTPVFSIGFGPAILQKKIGDTTFQLAALPLGGFVSMNMEQLAQKAYWQKMIIILSGIFNNIVLAFIAMLCFFMINRADILPVIRRVSRNSPASKSGLIIGDRIIGLDGQPINSMPTFLHYIHDAPGKEVKIEVERENQQLIIPVRLGTKLLIGNSVGYLGVQFAKKNNRLSFGSVIQQTIQASKNLIRINIQFLKTLFGLPRSSRKPDLDVFAGRNIQTGLSFFLFFIAYTSIQIGLFNILPIPMLDGGQAFHYTISTLFGRFLTEKQISWFYYFLLLLLLIIVVLPKRRKK